MASASQILHSLHVGSSSTEGPLRCQTSKPLKLMLLRSMGFNRRWFYVLTHENSQMLFNLFNQHEPSLSNSEPPWLLSTVTRNNQLPLCKIQRKTILHEPNTLIRDCNYFYPLLPKPTYLPQFQKSFFYFIKIQIKINGKVTTTDKLCTFYSGNSIPI